MHRALAPGPDRRQAVKAMRARRAALWTVLALSAPLAAAPTVGDLVLNEVMADNVATLADEVGQFDDWIEILNPTGADLPLAGLYLTDDPQNLTKWRFPAGVAIAAGEHLLVWADGDPPVSQLHASFRLSAGGESVLLVASDGAAVIDEVDFPSLAPDVSYARVPDAGPVWRRTDVATPGAPNQGPTGSELPRLNEILIQNATTRADEGGDHDPWLEVFNASGVEAALGDLHLTDDLAQPTKWRFPPGLMLQPDAFLLVWLDGEPSEGPLHTAFALPPAGGSVWLTSADGAAVVDQITVGPQAPDTARGRFPDGADTFRDSLRPTPADRNEATDPALGLVISEVIASNATGLQDNFGDFEDWVEIQNTGAAPRSLAGMFLTDDLADTIRWQIPNAPGTTLQPGQSVVFIADGEPLEGPLHTNFRLDADGEVIGLFGTLGTGNAPIDTVHFGGARREATDTAEARFGPARAQRLPTSTPTPGAANAFGLTLDEVAGILLGAFPLPSEPASAEADANRDGRHDAGDVVRRVNAE